MTEVECPSLAAIRRHVGEASLHKARGYLHDETWSNLSRRGAAVRGLCRGNGPSPYRVEIVIADDEVAHSECSCPVGVSGHCKHVAALLLYRRSHPDAFLEAEEPEVALEKWSKHELIALVCRMIRRAPELECLLDSPLPGAADAANSADPEAYRRQARAAYARDGAVAEVVRELADIVAVGDEFRTLGDVAAAAAAYRGVADVALDEFERGHDGAGDTLAVVGRCARGLRACLVATPHAQREERRELLRALWEFYRTDEAHGGLGDGDEVEEALVRRTTPEERRWLADWVRSAPPPADGWSGDYARGAYGELLRRLERGGTK